MGAPAVIGLSAVAIAGAWASTSPAHAAAEPNALLPTDVVPIPGAHGRFTGAQNLQIKLLEKLPPRFYLNANVDTSFRLETNPYQFPTKRAFLRQVPTGEFFHSLSPFDQQQVMNSVRLASSTDVGFRVVPNITAGWALAPNTRIYSNWFMLRDQMFHNVQLNTVANSVGGGIQQIIPIGRRTSVTADFQFRNFYASHHQHFFDFLPSLTAQYVVNPNLAVYANTLLQLRGEGFFTAPTKEIDPFYTFGTYWNRHGWAFTNSMTFLQNFREPFASEATVRQDSYSIICDFEIARPISKRLPSLQAYVRAEPIFNFHSRNRPGLAGNDFRLYWGMRMSANKPALNSGIAQMIKQLDERDK